MSRTVTFFEAGRWAEVDVQAPQFEVKAGEVKEISNGLAEIVVDAGRGAYVPDAPVKKDDLEDALKAAEEADALKAAEEADALKAADSKHGKKRK